ncbi:response regulator transcription factor [Trichlorobacter ammonificans]|uniref:LuxR family two component transcriptional regulator n=1 Tax=Trichlorobacter ammonificans TaxID=2916410 RepID=A0ABM9D7W5_9BACT|nr:response regulator transcription factor [Trichlorobacter ammonificans]CAH2031151.1 LuxR family two component transcriptional regulator [Trichlorobacter ammonificans]
MGRSAHRSGAESDRGVVMEQIRVLLVDDHKIMRDGLQSLLEQSGEITVIAQAASGQEAIRLFHELQPDLTIMDLTMPEMSGIEATRRIVAEQPEARVLALSMVMEQDCVLECLKAGAKGYLVKDCAADELLQAVCTVHKGGSYLCSRATTLVVHGMQAGRESEPSSCLTEREQEVLQLLADGFNTKEIAFKLEISTKTVETQRAAIMKKLDLYSIAELTKYALQQGLTDLNLPGKTL